MAKKTTTTTTVTDNDAETNDEIALGTAEAEDSSLLSDVLDELIAAGADDDVQYRVHCVFPNHKSGYCTTYVKGELSLDKLRDDYGGGRYKITAVDSNNRYVARRTITIAEAVKPAVSTGPSITEIAQLVSSNKGGVDIAMILQLMQSQMQAQAQMFTAILNRPQPPAPDPLAMIAALKDVLAPPKQTSDAVETLLKGLELGKEIAGTGDGGGDWPSVILKGFGMAEPILKKMGEGNVQAAHPESMGGSNVGAHALPNKAVVAPRQPQIIAPVHSGSAVHGEISSQTLENENVNIVDSLKMMPWLKQQLAALILQASRQKDPELYAEVFLDNLPEFVTPELLVKNFNRDNALEMLAMVDARVEQFPEWFGAFRDAVLDMLEMESRTDYEAQFGGAGQAADSMIPLSGESLERNNHDD